jgi:hypothetical protein
VRWIVSSISLLVLGFVVSEAVAADPSYGRYAVGVRTVPLAASAGAPAGQIQLWYPAAAADCATPLRYGDYLRADARQPGQDVAAELRQAWTPPLDDAQWARVTTAPMRGCRDASPAATRAPLILALHLQGAWPVAAEFFASHGYAFAVVSRPAAPPASADLVDRIAQRHREFVRDLRDAIAQLRASDQIDASRVGAIGQSHALLMLAMAEPSVRAVALQDSACRAQRRHRRWLPHAPVCTNRDAATRRAGAQLRSAAHRSEIVFRSPPYRPLSEAISAAARRPVSIAPLM